MKIVVKQLHNKFSLAAVLTVFSASAFGADAITGLSVDHMTEPGDRGPAPSFSWRMESDRIGAMQTAYRIKVFAGELGGRMVCAIRDSRLQTQNS